VAFAYFSDEDELEHYQADPADGKYDRFLGWQGAYLDELTPLLNPGNWKVWGRYGIAS
jgi:hypothetical protein